MYKNDKIIIYLIKIIRQIWTSDLNSTPSVNPRITFKIAEFARKIPKKISGEGIKVNKYRRKCSEKAPAFVGILVDLLGPESKSQIEQIEHQLYNVEEEVNYLRRRNPNMDDVTRIIDAQMSLLLYSFAARLEAMVHEKKEMAKKSEKESSNKSAVKKLGIIAENASQLSTFLTVSECVYLPEWANLDFW